MTRILLGLLALALVLAVVYSIRPSEPKVDPNDPNVLISILEQASQYTEWFYQGNLVALSEAFSAPMGQLLPADELRKIRDRTLNELGEELEVTKEGIAFVTDHYLYERVALFDKHDGQVQIQMTLNVNHELIGFTIQPIDTDL